MNHSHPPDRPVWSALTNRQAHLALGDPRIAVRFPPEIETFGPTAADTPEQLSALGALTPNDAGLAIVERHGVMPPARLVTMIEEPIHQMTAARLPDPDHGLNILALGDADAAEMRAMVELT